MRRYLVEEALAELVHGALQLVPLALPLLVVAHGLGRGPLPRGGPGVVVHVVVPAPLVHPLLPAGGSGGPQREGGREREGLRLKATSFVSTTSGRRYKKNGRGW